VTHASSLVIFDLDGTIVDSSLDLANSTNELLEGYGGARLPVEQVTSMVGEGAQKLVARALKAARRDVDLREALDRFREIYSRRLLEHTRPYDGVVEVIAHASARAQLALLTNKPEAPSRRLLDAFGLSAAFRWVIGGDSGFPRKPDPQAVAHLLQAAGVSRDHTLFVGDSMIDVETARHAGVRMCVARYGFGHLRGELVLEGDELIAMTPADIAPAIDALSLA
jgi:phosphoglycolate phosphatase